MISVLPWKRAPRLTLNSNELQKSSRSLPPSSLESCALSRLELDHAVRSFLVQDSVATVAATDDIAWP